MYVPGLLREAEGGSPVETLSVLTCPSCGASHREQMPDDRCVVRYRCGECGSELRPETGDCCVFCSHGSRPCPPVQENGECR